MFGKRRRAASNPVGALWLYARLCRIAHPMPLDRGTMLTCRPHAAPTRAPERVRFSRGDKGVRERPRIESKSLQRRSRRGTTHPCHHTNSRRRHRDQAHGAAQLRILQRQQRLTTATRGCSAATVELGVYDRAHLSQPITRKRPQSRRVRRASCPLRPQDYTAEQHYAPSCVQPRPALSRRIASTERRRPRCEPR
jgi:hypothetical protein